MKQYHKNLIFANRNLALRWKSVKKVTIRNKSKKKSKKMIKGRSQVRIRPDSLKKKADRSVTNGGRSGISVNPSDDRQVTNDKRMQSGSKADFE